MSMLASFPLQSSFKSAGILAGMHPCGVIVLLSELYTSESKSQVYGCLHNYYSLHPSTVQNIGIYDTMLGAKLKHILIMLMHLLLYRVHML